MAHLPVNICCPRRALTSFKASGSVSSYWRPKDNMNSSSALSSSSVGKRKSTPGMRFRFKVKCRMTAPTEKRRRLPPRGAPSPDHPVRGPCGLATDVRHARV